MVNNLPAMQETWEEDPLEEGMVTHSRITHAVFVVAVSLQLHQYRPFFRSTIAAAHFVAF